MENIFDLGLFPRYHWKNGQPYQRHHQNLHQTSELIAKDLRQSEKNRAGIRIDLKERRK
jgi:hypothetical protein